MSKRIKIGRSHTAAAVAGVDHLPAYPNGLAGKRKPARKPRGKSSMRPKGR